jgi:hypothetical protein
MPSGGYYRKLEEAERRGEKGKCRCFDCCRRVGVTPPAAMRDQHKQINIGKIPREMKENELGVPVPAHPSDDEKAEARTAEERSHLRHAVANREAI